MTAIALTQDQISAGIYRGFKLSAAQLTFSIPNASTSWAGYPTPEPTDGYLALTAGQGDNVRKAISAWNTLIATDITEVTETANTWGEIRFAFTNISGPYAYSAGGNPAAVNSGFADIWIDNDFAGKSFDPGSYDYYSLLHEIGHSIGLEHSFVSMSPYQPKLPVPYESRTYTVMSYTDAARSQVALPNVVRNGSGQITGSYVEYTNVVTLTPMVLDVAMIQSLYGADTATGAGNSVYTFTENASTRQTIYDAGGIDTIDLSNFTRNSILDLTPGSMSSIGLWYKEDQIAYWNARYGTDFAYGFQSANLYLWEDNLGIAFSTVIENAIGGAGRDTLIGNAVANTLTGGAGDDMLYGMDGDDLLVAGTGNDLLRGGAGNDSFYLGANYTVADDIDGEAGTVDQLGLQGVYDLTFLAGSLKGVESIALLSSTNTAFGGQSAAPNSYVLHMVDGNVAAGQQMTVHAGDLAANETFTFDGALETDGSFRTFGGLGRDTITGGAMNDAFYFGPDRFTVGQDVVDGGAGSRDQIGLDFSFSGTLTAGSIRNVETIALLPGGGTNTFSLAIDPALATAGQALTIYAVEVATGVTVSGTGVQGALTMFGGAGQDTLLGGAGGDWLFGGNGRDTLLGGAGADTFYYDGVLQSSGATRDTIDFDGGVADRIDLPFAVTGIAAGVSGQLSSGSFDADLARALGSAQLGDHQAVLFTASGGDLSGTFLIVDTNGGGYQAGVDYVMQLTASPASLSLAGFI